MSALDEILRSRDELPPAPRFDRVAVRTIDVFSSVPRLDHGLLASGPSRLLGIAVIVDETVEPGVLELRQGDQVVERIRL